MPYPANQDSDEEIDDGAETSQYSSEARMNILHRSLLAQASVSSTKGEAGSQQYYYDPQVSQPHGYYVQGAQVSFAEPWSTFINQRTVMEWDRLHFYQHPHYHQPDDVTSTTESFEHIQQITAYPLPPWTQPTAVLTTETQSPNSDTGADLPRQTHQNLAKADKKRFTCEHKVENKVICDAIFARKADRDRHRTCVHLRDQSRFHPCHEPGCTRNGPNGFTRKDHLTEHARNFHQKDIPKRVKGRGRVSKRAS